MVTMTVMKASLMLEYLHHCTPALIVVSVNLQFRGSSCQASRSWYGLFGGMFPVKSWISRKPNLPNDASADVSGEMLVVQAATVLSLGAKSRLRERMVLGVGKLTRAAVEVVGKERQPAAGASRHQQNDVSLGCNAGSLRRLCRG